MDVRNVVYDQMQQVAVEQGKRLVPLADDVALLESGLDSLCFAVIVARLEMLLGTDPFVKNDDVQFPVTVGDLVRLYEDALLPA